MWLLCLLGALLHPVPRAAGQPTALPEADRVRLAEAFRLAHALQDSLWTGWSRVPFAVLLVTPEAEFLVRHPRPSPDFRRLGYDSLLAGPVYVRDPTLPPHLLATFPAVGGVPTVVVGQPSATGMTSTFWVLTLLHEHFHQLQQAQPDYPAATRALGLAGEDETGQWMLDFPFPYDSVPVGARFAALSAALAAALRAENTPAFGARLAAYRAARTRLRAALPDVAYRYLSFQLWQEGVARYTAYRIAAAATHTPAPAFQALDDYVPFAAAADTMRQALLRELDALSLAEWRRVAFYPVGAAEALLLDRLSPAWRQRYFQDWFYLERYAPPQR